MIKNRYKLFFIAFALCVTSTHARGADHAVLPLYVDSFTQKCVQTLRFKVHTTEEFLSSLRWYNEYVFDEHMAFLPVCFEFPLASVETNNHTSKFSPVHAEVIFINATKAFVRGNKLHISTAHPYHVLVHELAHLVYFADEYELSDRLLAQQCHPKGYANKRPTTLSSDEDYIWELLKQLDAKTVDPQCTEFTGHEWSSIKHLKWHFLQYADVRYIPRIYQHIWQNRLFTKAKADAM